MSNQAKLTFSEEDHVYRWNDQIVPSVSEIIKPATGYNFVPAHILEAAAARGTLVHKLTEDADFFRLDRKSIPDNLAGYLDAWERFKQDADFRMVLCEAPLYCSLGFAGTIDRIGYVEKFLTILDIKTSKKIMFAHGLQTAAYKLAAIDNGIPVEQRAIVQLKPCGNYVFKRQAKASDYAHFFGLLKSRSTNPSIIDTET